VRANLMWAATQALNGLIGAGVPQDWATHMIGHELTALARAGPRADAGHRAAQLLQAPRRQARQAAAVRRACGSSHSGSEDERIDAAIARTRAFFESLGVKTRLSDYGIGADAVDKHRRPARRPTEGPRLGEHRRHRISPPAVASSKPACKPATPPTSGHPTHRHDPAPTLPALQAQGPHPAQPHRHPADVPVQATDGVVNDWHRVHYPALARGGAGLLIVEATAVSPEGRITPGCLGLWNDEQAAALAPIAASIKAAGAVPGIQIGHAGRKASANRPWEGDDHIADDDARGWETLVALGHGLRRQPAQGAARHDGGRHRPRARRLRRRRPPRARRRLRVAGAALRPRLPRPELLLGARQPAQRRLRRQLRGTAAASCSRPCARCARCGRRTCR
jgi:hypothetical protein